LEVGYPAGHYLAFGSAGLLLAGKWVLVYGLMDFTGHETSYATVALLGLSLALVVAGICQKPPEPIGGKAAGKEYAQIKASGRSPKTD